MPEGAGGGLTQLLNAISAGDSRAASDLLPLVYETLRSLAHAEMAREPGGNTLQPTALVHEAYLRLVGDGDVAWSHRGHFFGAAARAMRRILVDRARARGALKRGGDARRVPLAEDLPAANESPPGEIDVLALDSALDRLAARDERWSEIVMLRYFAGLTLEETAASMGLSLTIVKAEWAYARAWLRRELTEAPAGR